MEEYWASCRLVLAVEDPHTQARTLMWRLIVTGLTRKLLLINGQFNATHRFMLLLIIFNDSSGNK